MNGGGGWVEKKSKQGNEECYHHAENVLILCAQVNYATSEEPVKG